MAIKGRIAEGLASFTTTGPDLEKLEFWSKFAMKAVVDAATEHLIHRVFVARQDVNGLPFPKGITLVDTGEFIHGLKGRIQSPTRARIGPSGKTRGYAKSLNLKYAWAGLSTHEKKLLDAALGVAVDLAIAQSLAK